MTTERSSRGWLVDGGAGGWIMGRVNDNAACTQQCLPAAHSFTGYSIWNEEGEFGRSKLGREIEPFEFGTA